MHASNRRIPSVVNGTPHTGSALSRGYPPRFVPPMTTVRSRGSPAESFEIPYLVIPLREWDLALTSIVFYRDRLLCCTCPSARSPPSLLMGSCYATHVPAEAVAFAAGRGAVAHAQASVSQLLARPHPSPLPEGEGTSSACQRSQRSITLTVRPRVPSAQRSAGAVLKGVPSGSEGSSPKGVRATRPAAPERIGASAAHSRTQIFQSTHTR